MYWELKLWTNVSQLVGLIKGEKVRKFYIIYIRGKFWQKHGRKLVPASIFFADTWWVPSINKHLQLCSKRQIFQWLQEVPFVWRTHPARTQRSHNFIKDFQSWTMWKHTTRSENVSKVCSCNNIFQLNYPQLSLLPHGMHYAPSYKDQLHPFSQSLFKTTFQVVFQSTINAGESHRIIHSWLRFASNRSLASFLSTSLQNHKFFTGLAEMQGIQWISSPLAHTCIEEFATNFYQCRFICCVVASNLFTYL